MSDEFFKGYVECALWSSNDEDGTPLDTGRDGGYLADATRTQMRADCADFEQANAALLDRAYQHVNYGPTQAGHDFWLTRVGHGAGFWDRGLGEIGDALTLAAHVYGNVDLYVGDDGRIYA